VANVAQECRERVARLLGVQTPEQIVLCQNSTYALNLAFLGFPLRRGDVVLTTAQERNAVLRPLYRLKRKGLARLCIVPVDRQGRVLRREFDLALREHAPRLVALGHASNVTGALQEVRELFRAARARGAVTLLDASQSLGLEEVRAEELGADMIAFAGHKYLLGPEGTGGLYVRPEIELEPALVGDSGVRSDREDMPPDMPGRLEPGTLNLPALAGLAHALRWSEEHPVDRQRLDALCLQLARGLESAGASVVAVQGARMPVMSCALPGWNVDEAARALHKSFGVVCRAGLQGAPLIHACIGTAPQGTLRPSPSRFSTEQDVECAVQALRELLSGFSGRGEQRLDACAALRAEGDTRPVQEARRGA
jgi:selenocysteine lyase/cysteine desulfurase